ncbi:nitroreductase [Novosphingobium kaempferiae]|uniref:nitroreductase n=1 Tax=Novosphingobium kaempferiae TaxID=2896849 RepID=UPI001E4F483D|nr:nitroreductase [Novosphingobium kaempferiae]
MSMVERESVFDDGADTSDMPDAIVLSRLLGERFSCRAYRQDSIPRPVIRRMLAMAQLSASWCNSQPWQTIVTEGAGTGRFATALFEHAVANGAANGGIPTASPDFAFPVVYRGVYKERQREVGRQLYESVGITRGDREASGRQALQNFRLFDAPHALIVTSERDLGTYGAIDTGIYVGNLLLAAQSLGLGIVPQAALAGYAPLIREYFNIPENRLVVLGASFGYPDLDHPANSFRSRRACVEDVVDWVTT